MNFGPLETGVSTVRLRHPEKKTVIEERFLLDEDSLVILEVELYRLTLSKGH